MPWENWLPRGTNGCCSIISRTRACCSCSTNAAAFFKRDVVDCSVSKSPMDTVPMEGCVLCNQGLYVGLKWLVAGAPTDCAIESESNLSAATHRRTNTGAGMEEGENCGRPDATQKVLRRCPAQRLPNKVAMKRPCSSN